MASRCVAVMAVLGGATAFTAPNAGAPAIQALNRRALCSDGGCEAEGTQVPRSTGFSNSVGLTSLTGAVASLLFLRAAARRQGARKELRRKAEVTRRADDDIEMGFEDSFSGVKNYVNPWEEFASIDVDTKAGKQQIIYGEQFHPYDGPVYKKVPVAEGISFPLDPTKFYEPLEPPEPGGKWGDGRSPDGNWYMEVDGETIQYWQGQGKRKRACAVVRVMKGTGQFIVNSMDGAGYCHDYPIWWYKAMEPICSMGLKNECDIIVKAFGGGVGGQMGAIRVALARALAEKDYSVVPLLKRAMYLHQDPRQKEAKKTGRPKARKSKPWHKR